MITTSFFFKNFLKVTVLFIFIFIFSTLPPATLAQSNQFFNSLYDDPVPNGILDGQETTFVVTGYSTSLWPDDNSNWPAVLQNMLNMHAGNSNTYKVYNEAKGSTPIARWTKICATDSISLDVINKYKNNSGRKIMLGQQSTQWAFGDCSNDGRLNEIEVNPGETPGSSQQSKIQQGADAINYFADLWLNNGFDRVYMGTHIYTEPLGCCFNKRDHFHFHLYGERFAMAKALDQGSSNLYPGPETWGVTKGLYPDPFASEADICGFHTDGRHPLARTTAAMALYWYTVLAGNTAKQNVMQYAADLAGVPFPSAGQPLPIKGAYCNGGSPSSPTPTPNRSPGTSPTPESTRTPKGNPTSTPIGTVPPVTGDSNGDGKVDGLDYVIWLSNYNTQTSKGASKGDFDGNGVVDGLDYVLWLNNYTL